MEGSGLGAGLGALGFWGFVAIVVVAGIWGGIRKRDAHHETIRRIIESGQPIDQALLDKLLAMSGGGDHLGRDLKVTGLIVLFTAPGLVLLGWLVGQEHPAWLLPLVGVASLVGCVGLGLLVAAKLTRH